mmetsp:Transcript_14021/g.52413  ORF Transcript_14021/g.52413 Transcript_14021/m.52413 type:complete len:273 (+) Transcript_14021:1400-2218(+)
MLHIHNIFVSRRLRIHARGVHALGMLQPAIVVKLALDLGDGGSRCDVHVAKPAKVLVVNPFLSGVRSGLPREGDRAWTEAAAGRRGIVRLRNRFPLVLRKGERLAEVEDVPFEGALSPASRRRRGQAPARFLHGRRRGRGGLGLARLATAFPEGGRGHRGGTAVASLRGGCLLRKRLLHNLHACTLDFPPALHLSPALGRFPGGRARLRLGDAGKGLGGPHGGAHAELLQALSLASLILSRSLMSRPGQTQGGKRKVWSASDAIPRLIGATG